MLEIDDREDRPAYVRFERVPKEDIEASRREGKFVARDIDIALITPPYSKDVFKIKVSQWFENLKQDASNGRIPQKWIEGYQKSYQAWCNGQEVPLNGTAIRGWGLISPAQQETLVRMNVLTVEDLAGINDEGIKRIGMGSVDLRNKAKAWLSQLHDKGPLAQEVAALKNENEDLRASLESLRERMEEIVASKESVKVTVEGAVIPELMENEERDALRQEYVQLFGKMPHHLMKTETIKRRIEERTG